MDKPKIIKHLILIGFTEIIGEYKPVWGQGDGDYWHGKLKRNNDEVFTDRDTTLYKYTFNGIVKNEEWLMKLT